MARLNSVRGSADFPRRFPTRAQVDRRAVKIHDRGEPPPVRAPSAKCRHLQAVTADRAKRDWHLEIGRAVALLPSVNTTAPLTPRCYSACASVDDDAGPTIASTSDCKTMSVVRVDSSTKSTSIGPPSTLSCVDIAHGETNCVVHRSANLCTRPGRQQKCSYPNNTVPRLLNTNGRRRKIHREVRARS